MFVRNSNGDLITIDETNILTDTQLYNMIWSIKFDKVIHPVSNKISVDKMKQYLNSKCFSL